MMELVMYGMIPSANTEKRVSAPPEKRLMMPTKPEDPCRWSSSWTKPTSTTGTGTHDPNRKRAMMPSVKRIFARRSGTRKELRNAFSTAR